MGGAGLPPAVGNGLWLRFAAVDQQAALLVFLCRQRKAAAAGKVQPFQFADYAGKGC